MENREAEYVLFGAGRSGREAIDIIGKENIAFFLDNDVKKSGNVIEGISVYTYLEKKEAAIKKKVIVTVANRYSNEIISQLSKDGFTNIKTLQQIQIETTKAKIESRPDFIGIYKKAIEWIYCHTIEEEGIICNTELRKSYPEVSGYYIPTLIKWGYKELAIQYAKWLCSIQKSDGSWYDTNNTMPYVFDTAQVLKGLLAIRVIYPDVDRAIKRGCDWIVSNIQKSGRLTTPDKTAWGDKGEGSE